VMLNTSGPLPGNGAMNDQHASPTNILTSPGVLAEQQTQSFNDKRSGAVNMPMTKSGFVIAKIVTAKPIFFGGGLEIVTSKNGQKAVADNIASDAGTGSIIQPQDV